MEKIHLHSNFTIDLYSISQPKIQYVYFFIAIGFIILIIISINYTNLAVAKYSNRTTEVGIRKTCGSFKNQLAAQFFIESFLLVILAYLCGVFLVEIFMPQFNQFTDKDLYFSYSNWQIILGAVCVIFFTAGLSGLYPALYLSSLSPIHAIKGAVRKGSNLFRKSLVIIQFSMGCILIISTITVFQQLNYVKTKNLGINKNHIIYLNTKGELKNKFSIFKKELENSTDIIQVSHTSGLPTYTTHSTSFMGWGKDFDKSKQFQIYKESIEPDYLKTLNIKLVEGRDFIFNSSADSSNYIVNESAVRKMELQNPIGEQFSLWGSNGSIIGVMKDFHFKSLHEKVEPLVYQIGKKVGAHILIKLKGNNFQSEIETVRKVYNSINPAYPFDYHFLDEEFEKLYIAEQRTSGLLATFSIVAIFLACLGFLGLSSYMAEQRSKEIAIRKIFGASPKQIGFNLLWTFTKWILIANIIAIPIAYWATNSWLEKFAYRISLGYQVFLLTIVFTIIIAICAQFIQVIRAIHKNPADSLKYE